jgi:hypothetical protein
MEYVGLFLLFGTGLFVGWLLTEIAARKKKIAQGKMEAKKYEERPFETRLSLIRSNDGYLAEITYAERFVENAENKSFLVTPQEFQKAPLSSLLVQVGFHPIDVADSFAEAEGKSANSQHPMFNEAIGQKGANGVEKHNKRL